MRHAIGLFLGTLPAVGLVLACLAGDAPAADALRPNILWITCEDISPDLGCYGDSYARTPNLDRLASQGTRFTHCFTHIGVCAPSRSGIITGMYPTSLGTHNMRCRAVLPDYVKCFPEYLREAGYYCTNNSKTDYQFDPPKTAWDENSGKAHWRGRKPGQPFFAVFNFTVTHESQIRAPEKGYQQNTKRLRPEDRHDPALAKIPPYYPDTPAVRRDWARYCDNITAMDFLVADMLAELEADGLADSTIVFFYSDHGRGLPRAKRWIYDASLRVPLIVRWPEKLKPGAMQPGTVNDNLVAFVDLAPTVLSLAGLPVPSHMQGQVFLGEKTEPPREYIYAARDRMDERYDMLRGVRDKQYEYIRNFQPWKPYAQNIGYMNEMPTMQELRRLSAEGILTGDAAVFMTPTKPEEELYDTLADPHEVHNLAASAEHQEVLERMRAAQAKWSTKTDDVGLIPEPIINEWMRTKGAAWREEVRDAFPFDRLRKVVSLGQQRSALFDTLGDSEAAVRYWAVTSWGRAAHSDAAAPQIAKLLADGSPIVRIGAAEALVRLGHSDMAMPVLIELLAHEDFAVGLNAALVLDEMGPADAARPAIPALRAAAARDSKFDYVKRVAEHALKQLGE